MKSTIYNFLCIFLLAVTCHQTAISQVFGSDSIKYNPGHYIAIQQQDHVTEIEFLNDPVVAGVIKRYNWSVLEPDFGEYDFSSIMADLDTLSKYNKQLVVFFVDKSFDGSMIMPDYLTDYTLTEGNIVIAHRWHPFIIERLSKLADTLASLVDTVANFEGIALQESALSLSQAAMDENVYTPEIYRDALIETMTNMATSFKHSRIVWYMNFFPRNNKYLSVVAEALVPYNIMLCGPDILPYRTGLITHTYPVYHEFYTKLPLGCSVQWDSYRHHSNDLSVSEIEEVSDDGYIPMDKIFRYGRDSLKLNYIFWQYKTWATNGQYSVFDAYDVMRRYPVFNYPFSNHQRKTKINPNSASLRYCGALNKKITDSAAVLLRFTDDYLNNGTGFSPQKARTQSGVSIRFKTGSPKITMHFDSLDNATYRWNNFAVFRNGTLYKDKISELTFDINNPEEEMQEYEVYFPSFTGLVFKGLEIVEGYTMETTLPEERPYYVAIGNSITHGVGQSFGSHLTYPYHLAQALGYRLINMAVGGSRVNSGITQNLAALNKDPKLITVLWGYNDAVFPQTDLSGAFEKYEILIEDLAERYPEIPIVGILQTYTSTAVGNNPDNTIDRLRNGQREILKMLSLKYNNIQIIDGWDYTDVDDLADVVHLNDEGAVHLAEGLIDGMKKEMAFAPLGATWYYEELFPFSGDIDYIRMSVDRDTVINGKPCSVIEKRHQLSCFKRADKEYLYKENRKVYFWSDSLDRFQLLYDFNAREGDQWNIEVHNPNGENATGTVTVDSVFYTEVNDMSLLTFNVTYKVDSGLSVVSNSFIMERVGDLGYLFPFNWLDPDIACDGNRTNGLRCYIDETVGLYKTDTTDCDFTLTSVRMHKAVQPAVIYPNPGSGIFFIRSIKKYPVWCQLYACTGRLVLEEELLSNQIILTGVPEGIYFVNLTDREGESYQANICILN